MITAEERLLTNSPSVLALFAGNPFPGAPPRQVRAVIWQYWFTDRAEKHQGFWWRRQLLGAYAPTLEREEDGRFAVIGAPEARRDGRTLVHKSRNVSEALEVQQLALLRDRADPQYESPRTLG